MRPIVIGVGNRWRGDDGVGPVVVAAIDDLDLDADLLALDGDPARIVDAWWGRSCAVVVDAAVAGEPPGTVHVVTDVDRLTSTTAVASSHAAGITDAVALGRALGRLPDRLVVVGVEPAWIDHGDELSPAVSAVIDDVVGLVAEEIRDVARSVDTTHSTGG